MKFLRHVLFAALLLLTQTGALTHAVEHLRVDADDSTAHICTLCIAAQGLDAALASAPPDFVRSSADFAPTACVVVAAFYLPAVSPRARAPPAA